MGIDEKQEFEDILNYFAEKYHLIVERPYDDDYIVIYKDAYDKPKLGDFNYRGFSLLYNLTKLCSVLQGELR